MAAAKATYLRRYLAGEYEPVWAELQALGAAVREEPLYSDAQAVARETMRRVRHNLELLSARLQTIGYSFSYEWARAELRMMGIEDLDLDPHLPREFVTPNPVLEIAPLDADVAAQLAEMETLRGQIPLSVMAWYQVVGSVNFTGLAPESWWRMGSEPRVYYWWTPPPAAERANKERALEDERLLECRAYTYYLDPICFGPLGEAIRDARSDDALLRGELDFANLSEWRDHYVPKIPMGPDMHHKFGYSGGGPIGVRAPEPAMDGLVVNYNVQMLFVDYLRLCCRNAGLPGLPDLPRRIREQEIPAQVEQIERDLHALTAGLLPF
jgi:hypothetical protein